ncbi:MAG: hypothetical protein JSV89_08770 [Spirochaetaceae bacterium]|nr:MAG: hypothetical protein JSV89_08770 [Spirochaetaceae bacterium]
MKRIILLLIVVGIIGLAVGYLIFARTSSGYVSIQVLISPSKNVLDDLVKSVTGIKKIRQNILICGAVGAGVGLVLGLVTSKVRG